LVFTVHVLYLIGREKRKRGEERESAREPVTAAELTREQIILLANTPVSRRAEVLARIQGRRLR
jgi:hypothetical protein